VTRLGVLVSGQGSNLRALYAAIQAGRVPATVALVGADREAPALTWAREQGLATFLADARALGRAAFEESLGRALDAAQVEALVLAGFLRVLSPALVARYPDRILNVHPSLLPAFPGLDAIGQALAHGVRVTGVTVHLVSAELDAGPIVLQEPVAVDPAEGRAAVEARVHAVEHRLLPEAVRLLCEGRIRTRGRIVDIVEG